METFVIGVWTPVKVGKVTKINWRDAVRFLLSAFRLGNRLL